MKRTVALAAFAAASLFGQDITGVWQGTLQTPQRDLRIVVKVAKEQSGLKAVMYSIDQGGGGIGGTVTLQAPAVKIAIPGIGATYEGKLDSDGVTLAGTWSQGQPLPLSLKHVKAEEAWPIPEVVRPKAMAADANPAFEVATIKPARPEAQGKGFRVNGRQFSTLNTSVVDLLEFAYGLHARQVTGGPAWMETEKYDITAKPDGEGQPNDRQWKTMVQRLIADRFKLVFHRDKKELSVYAITVTKTGLKLTKSEGDPNGLPALFFRQLGALTVRNATMQDFAGTMQGAVLDRPVVDQTGLADRWDFTLTWTPDEFQFAGLGARPAPPTADKPDAPPDLYSAIQQQLGLKIESTKAPVDVLVIDRVEKPSEN
jgi:uncharacterized protein (TIGR03435 family)